MNRTFPLLWHSSQTARPFTTCEELIRYLHQNHEYNTTRELVEALVRAEYGVTFLPTQASSREDDPNRPQWKSSDASLLDPIRWPPAVQEEPKSHEENGTWKVQEISQMPHGCMPIPGKWIFKRKLSSDGSIRYKARLVIMGFLQRFGIDFMETYAPTASLAAFRLLVAIAVFNGCPYAILTLSLPF
jgi:hypothetical protein